MKPNLGRALALMVALAAAVWAAPYEWSASISQSEAYVHEGVEIRYTCRFKDAGNLYVIDFNPPREGKGYRLKLLSESERIVSGIRQNDYRFLLFPTQAGGLDLEFSILMRKTTQASIENTVIGRDNVEYLDFTDTPIRSPKLHLNVKEAQARLAGTFTMDVAYSTDRLKAYEPLHLTVTVQGDGNMDKLCPFDLNISGVEIFGETPQSDFKLSPKGLRGTWVQRFALVSAESYTVPELTLRYFDTDAKEVRTLRSESRRIEVSKSYEPETLLDAPEAEPTMWKWHWYYLYCLVSFVVGFAIGKWRGLPRRREVQTSFAAQVKSAATPRELAVLLARDGDPRFSGLIEKLEHPSDPIALAEAKKEALALKKG